VFGAVRKTKKHNSSVRSLRKCPQRQGICLKVRIVKPKKPNSAQRKIVKVRLTTKRNAMCRIIGQGHNLRDFSNVLVSGGRAPDLPGVRYRLIKGKLDFSRVERITRRYRRSKYGVPLRTYF